MGLIAEMRVKVYVANTQKEIPVGARWVTRLVRLAAADAWQDGELSVAVVGAERMSEMNRRYTGRAGDADVLAFPLDDESDGCVGEVVVSASRAVREAAARGIPAKDELALYIVHGVLHLTGYDDGDAASRRKMYARERAALSAAGLGDIRRSPRAKRSE